MILRIKKTPEGCVLSCIRADDTVAVQRTAHGGFFALHDLMHYAVESTLGFRRAFLGLMADGWSFGTFGDRTDPRYGSMPVEAVWAENPVAALSRVCGDPAWRDEELLESLAEDVNHELSAVLVRQGVEGFRIAPEKLAETLCLFASLADRWAGVSIGGYLELEFPPADRPSTA
jgi:hypothetical protein